MEVPDHETLEHTYQLRQARDHLGVAQSHQLAMMNTEFKLVKHRIGTNYSTTLHEMYAIDVCMDMMV